MNSGGMNGDGMSNNRMTRLTVLLAVGALALASASCGDDGESGPDCVTYAVAVQGTVGGETVDYASADPIPGFLDQDGLSIVFGEVITQTGLSVLRVVRLQSNQPIEDFGFRGSLDVRLASDAETPNVLDIVGRADDLTCSPLDGVICGFIGSDEDVNGRPDNPAEARMRATGGVFTFDAPNGNELSGEFEIQVGENENPSGGAFVGDGLSGDLRGCFRLNVSTDRSRLE